VENILDYLEGKAPLKDENELMMMVSSLHIAASQTRMEKLFNDMDIEALLDKYEPFLIKLYDQVAEKISKENPDFGNNPFLKAFRANPVAMLKEMRRNPDFITQWATLDKKLPFPPNK